MRAEPQFWVWAEDCFDGSREQLVAIPYATHLEAERVAAAIQRIARRGVNIFVSVDGEEQEIEGAFEIPSGH